MGVSELWNRERADKLLEYAKAEDVVGMESYMAEIGASKLPPSLGNEKAIGSISPSEAKLLCVCCDNCNLEMLEFLVSKGLKLAKALETALLARMDERDVKASIGYAYTFDTILAWSAQRVGDYSTSQAMKSKGREFFMRLLKSGSNNVYLKSVFDISAVFRTFGEDREVLEALLDAGCDLIPTTHGYKRPSAKSIQTSDMNDEIHSAYNRNQETTLPSFLMNHGYMIVLSNDDLNLNRGLWKTWNDSPVILANLIMDVPPNSITPANLLPQIVAKAGSVDALRKLESWDGAYDEFNIQAAIDAASESNSIEAQAYLLDKKEREYGKQASSTTLGEGAVDYEGLREAIVAGAVSADGTLLKAALIEHEGDDLILPEGVVSMGKGSLKGFHCRRLVFPTTIEDIGDSNEIMFTYLSEIGLPASFAKRFNSLSMQLKPRSMYLYDENAVVRVFYHVQQKLSDKFDFYHGDTSEVAYAATRSHRSFKRYTEILDSQFRKNEIKSFSNKARVALSRLVDGTNLSADDKEMYTSYIKRNKKKLLPYFGECEDDLFVRITKQVFEELGIE